MKILENNYDKFPREREYDLCTEYQTYEEALAEGLRAAVKILKKK